MKPTQKPFKTGQDGCHMALPGHMCCTGSVQGELYAVLRGSEKSVQERWYGPVPWQMGKKDRHGGSQSKNRFRMHPAVFTHLFSLPLCNGCPIHHRLILPSQKLLKRPCFDTSLLSHWSNVLLTLHWTTAELTLFSKLHYSVSNHVSHNTYATM